MEQDFYQDGMDACAEGKFIDSCPHEQFSSERTQWIRGFMDFVPIREEWEHSNYVRSGLYPS